MADCGICLDTLRNPVSIPCGHVHCERCLRNHISSGVDALGSTCPTCRKRFHIATPDFAFVPQKYHDFILPPVRKIYMDIPSTNSMMTEIANLKSHLEVLTKENDRLRDRCNTYKYALGTAETEKSTALELLEQARDGESEVRRKYESLKRKYWETIDSSSNSSASHTLPRRSSYNTYIPRLRVDTYIPKEEDPPVDLPPEVPHRPKRALPRSRLSQNMRCPSDGSPHPHLAFVKRPRLNRYPDIGLGVQALTAALPDESEDDDDDEGVVEGHEN